MSQLPGPRFFLKLNLLIFAKEHLWVHQDKGYCMRGGTLGNETQCMHSKKRRVHPEVSPETLAVLRRFYKEHNQKFYELVGKNFGWPEEWPCTSIAGNVIINDYPYLYLLLFSGQDILFILS